MTKKDYDGPLYAPWDKVVEGRGFDPVEERKKQEATEEIVEEKPDYLVPVLMFLGVIFATLTVIVAGYIHGKMSVGAVWHNLHNFH